MQAPPRRTSTERSLLEERPLTLESRSVSPPTRTFTEVSLTHSYQPAAVQRLTTGPSHRPGLKARRESRRRCYLPLGVAQSALPVSCGQAVISGHG